MANEVDYYPSRQGGQSTIIPRIDPVIYAPAEAQAPFTDEQIKQYQQQGFIVIDNVFSEEEVKRLQQESQRLLNDDNLKGRGDVVTERNSQDIRSIFSVHNNNSVFSKLADDSRLTDIAQYILNDAVYIHQSRLNYKPGFEGGEFYWHSDFETWHVEDGMPHMRALSMSMTLTENYSFNGSLMVIPGSHTSYITCEGETPENHYASSLKKQEYGTPSQQHLKKLVEQQGIVTATCKPGSVIIFDCNTMHGSNSNITPLPRSNVFFVYNALSNKVGKPFCKQPPRPEFLACRENIKPLT